MGTVVQLKNQINNSYFQLKDSVEDKLMLVEEKIKSKIPELIKNIRDTQNKYIWMKAAMGILTTDLIPKLAMEECFIGNKKINDFWI